MPQGFQTLGGGLNSAFCKLFAIFSLLHHDASSFSVIPQRFRGVLPQSSPCGVDKSTFTHRETGRPACTTTQLNAKDIQNLSVIPQRFRGVLPQLLPCGISKHKLNTCDKTYKTNKGGLMNRIIVQYKLLRRIAWKII